MLICLCLYLSVNNLLLYFSFERVESRVLVIPFQPPATGPTTPDEFSAFEEFEEALRTHKFSAAVGWIVQQKENFVTNGKEYVKQMKQELQGVCPKVRNLISWSSTLFFLEQVCTRLIQVHFVQL